jgi:cell division protease FtsH
MISASFAPRLPFFRGRRRRRVSALLAKHFGRAKLESLSVAERQFPVRVRPDLQRAVVELFGDAVKGRQFFSMRQDLAMQTISFGSLLAAGWLQSPVLAPPEYEEVDVGEDRPVRCLNVGLWLLERSGHRYAVLLAPALTHGMRTGVSFQIATDDDAGSADIAEAIFKRLEVAVQAGRSYRGKILSLEMEQNFRGLATGIRVHKLRCVDRAQVILPAKTLALLERNVIRFVQRREKLSALGQSTRKGLLFYGPPGTGKTHTIHYLAAALTGHTTLLVTAEQVGLLAEYMALARLLQPSVVVIEDVDLIARDRSQMSGPCEESMLNKLPNEMDGLKESADVLFILTTNRPETLEAALASRPGRVDQAIEFPLPDEEGREKLVRLYGGEAGLTDELVSLVVGRTDRVSAAFIKELMRRSVQFRLEREGATAVLQQDVEDALDEMLFSGGSLNVKLLGGDMDGQHAGAGVASLLPG